MQRYEYDGIGENYHLALFKILTDALLDSNWEGTVGRPTLIDHSISLRSVILSNQEKRGDEKSGLEFMGWRSNIGDKGSLMNTESIAACALALGAGAKYVFEAGREPMKMDECISS